MKTKKYLIAIAIFGGVLFMAQAANQYNIDAEQTAQIKKKPRPIIR
ncbi:hypothetical protein [uncultured Algibacter sp.]|nr:hypothetical protein [uncultured Algibacter sp.]